MLAPVRLGTYKLRIGRNFRIPNKWFSHTYLMPCHSNSVSSYNETNKSESIVFIFQHKPPWNASANKLSSLQFSTSSPKKKKHTFSGIATTHSLDERRNRQKLENLNYNARWLYLPTIFSLLQFLSRFVLKYLYLPTYLPTHYLPGGW